MMNTSIRGVLLFSTMLLLLISSSGSGLENEPSLAPPEGSFGIRGLRKFRKGTGADMQRAVGLAKQTGIKWSGLHVFWDEIEPEKGKYRWDEFDNHLACILSHGIQVIVTIRSHSAWGASKARPVTPRKKEWLTHRASALPDPVNMPYYKAFVRSLVERYDGDDDFGKSPPSQQIKDVIKKNPIKYWQIENEPGRCNTQKGTTFWHGTADELATLIRIGSTSIKEADPGAKMVLTSFSPKAIIRCKPGKGYPSTVLKLLKQTGCDFDILDIHNYRDPETICEQVTKAKDLLKTYGFDGKPIWLGECDINWRNVPLGITEQEYDELRSAGIVKKHIVAFGCGVEKVLQWTFSDKEDAKWPPKSVPEITKFRGIVRSDLSPKPVYATYKLMISMLDGFTSCSDLSTGSVTVYRFMVRTNPVYVAWSQKGANTLALGIGKVRITDIHGRVTLRDHDPIVVSQAPVFIEEAS